MKKFYTDHYFQIGKLHYMAGKPCQDYALSGGSDRAACAIVSDGCSKGRHTDVGSRVQALSLLGAMRKTAETPKESFLEMAGAIREEKKKLLREAEGLLGLSSSDMLATSVYAHLSPQGGFVHIEGDGGVALKYRDGSVVTMLYEWDDNTPFYPSYSNGDLAGFVRIHGGDTEAYRLTRITRGFDADGRAVQEEQAQFTLDEGMSGIVETISVEELENLSYVAVFTDGVSQIEGAEWDAVMRELTSFKSVEGEFAKRRMIRGLKNYERSGGAPVDDISMAVVRVEHESAEEVDHVISNVEGKP